MTLLRSGLGQCNSQGRNSRFTGPSNAQQRQSTPCLRQPFICSIGLPSWRHALVSPASPLGSSPSLLSAQPASSRLFTIVPDRYILTAAVKWRSRRHRHTAHGSLPDPRGSGRGEGDTRLVSPAREEACAERARVKLHPCFGRLSSYLGRGYTSSVILVEGKITNVGYFEQVYAGSIGALVACTFRRSTTGLNNNLRPLLPDQE